LSTLTALLKRNGHLLPCALTALIALLGGALTCCPTPAMCMQLTLAPSTFTQGISALQTHKRALAERDDDYEVAPQ
jgi:hypothetical protein